MLLGLVILGSAVWRLLPRSQTLVLDSEQLGRVFEGIGACSAGASSRLLVEYPEPQRSEILDLLFKPMYGAGFQHLKVEIGGDINSTDGCEPSHQRGPDDLSFERGWEWWLMREARARSPEIDLDALAWGAPAWIGGGEFFSEDMAGYLIRFLQGARDVHGLELDYMGIWNEVGAPSRWVKGFRKQLDQSGFEEVSLVAPDLPRTWWFMEEMVADPELMEAVDVVGVHYPGGYSTALARDTGKRLWSSEDGPWDGTWRGASALARMLNRNYVEGRLTKTIIWSPVTSYYDCLPLPGSGVMRANTPWSGHYEIQPALWAVAHTTQFASPGWRYLGGEGCGQLDGGGSYVALLSPNMQDYSVIIETMTASAAQQLCVRIRGMSRGPLEVWRSTAAEQFVPQEKATLVDGAFRFVAEPHCIYSLTTTTGQKKGGGQPPSPGAFPFPFHVDFETGPEGSLPAWFADQGGAFEIQAREDGQGQALRQLMHARGIEWPWHGDPLPETIVGDISWTDYTVSVDARSTDHGRVSLYGRITEVPFTRDPPQGYGLWLGYAGDWELTRYTNRLAGGRIEAESGGWNRLALDFRGDLIRASVNGETVKEIQDATYPQGLVGLGSGWHEAEFDNLNVGSIAEP
jgi:galactosylceramidase